MTYAMGTTLYKQAAELGPTTTVTLNDVGNGEVTASLSSGNVRCINPDGGFEERPSGTAGAWEKARINGALMCYQPAPGVFYFVSLFAAPN